jgi:hypothetical protein
MHGRQGITSYVGVAVCLQIIVGRVSYLCEKQCNTSCES